MNVGYCSMPKESFSIAARWEGCSRPRPNPTHKSPKETLSERAVQVERITTATPPARTTELSGFGK
jgi:hypothetical protein